MADQSEEVIGDYKIEPGFLSDYCAVRKALGPWPLRNWSWISVYDGPVERCREYIRWVDRIDSGDVALIDHAAVWLSGKVGCPVNRENLAVEHLPKTWGYDFSTALSLHPSKTAVEVGSSVEALIAVIAIPVLLICGFFYHSM